MGINRTPYKSLDALANNARVDLIYADNDGIWLELKQGWQWDGQHGMREDSVADLKAEFRRVEPCECSDCVAIEPTGGTP